MYLLSDNFNQKGFAPIALVILLLFGIAAGTLLVQNGVNFLPKADGPEFQPATVTDEKVGLSCNSDRQLAYYCRLPFNAGWSCNRDQNKGCNIGGDKKVSDLFCLYSTYGGRVQKGDDCYRVVCNDPAYSVLKLVSDQWRCYPDNTQTCGYDEKYEEYQCSDGVRCFNDYYKDTRTGCEWASKTPHYHCILDNTCGQSAPPAPAAPQSTEPSGTIKVDNIDCSKRSSTGLCKVDVSFSFKNCDIGKRWIYWSNYDDSTSGTNFDFTNGKATIYPRVDDALEIRCENTVLAKTSFKLTSSPPAAAPAAAPAPAGTGQTPGISSTACSPSQITACQAEPWQPKGGCVITTGGLRQCKYEAGREGDKCNNDEKHPETGAVCGSLPCFVIDGLPRCITSTCSEEENRYCPSFKATCAVGEKVIAGQIKKYTYCKPGAAALAGAAPAAAVSTCTDKGKGYTAGGKRYECSNTRGSCAADAGVGVPFICNADKTWSNANSAGECTTECKPGAATTGVAPATPIITNCGKDPNDRDIPCYQIGVFNDAQTLASTEAGAKLASERYTQYEEIMAKISSKLSSEIKQKAEEKLKAAQAAADACLAGR